MRISVLNRQRGVRWDTKWIKRLAPRALNEALNAPAFPEAPLTGLSKVEAVVISDAAIAKVHAEFFNDPTPTDVITFDYGEILISADTAARKAEELAVPVEHEIALYMIHGLLHLNGHQDHAAPEAQVMKKTQSAILKRCVAALAMLVCAIPAYAQQEMSASDAQRMLQALHEIRDKQKTVQAGERERVQRMFLEAAASPNSALDLYEQAIKATQFEGKNRENTEFRDWKKKEDAKLDDSATRQAIQFQLRYLALTMAYSADPKSTEVIEALVQYMSDVQALSPEVLDREFMKRDISQSIFVKWLNLQRWISAKNWENVPAQVNGMAEKTLLPAWRDKKDPRLLAYWDKVITFETEQAGKGTGTFDVNRFNQIRKPILLWNRAQDLALLGQKSRAVADMFAIVKNYPGHPEGEKWIGQLEGLLSAGGSTAAAPAPAQ